MSRNPFREERQHLLEICRIGKAVIGPRNDIQPLGSRQGVKESLALMERHIFIVIAMNDQRWNRELSGRLVGNVREAVMIEGIVEGEGVSASREDLESYSFVSIAAALLPPVPVEALLRNRLPGI